MTQFRNRVFVFLQAAGIFRTSVEDLAALPESSEPAQQRVKNIDKSLYEMRRERELMEGEKLPPTHIHVDRKRWEYDVRETIRKIEEKYREVLAKALEFQSVLEQKAKETGESGTHPSQSHWSTERWKIYQATTPVISRLCSEISEMERKLLGFCGQVNDALLESHIAEGKGSCMNDERKFMEMAINEARKSKTEAGRNDATPFVGVVVVKDGEVIDKAHRGELGEGDHAEYTVLEKKLHDKSIAGATVFCTLEPCTTRRHPKLPCAERLVDRKVARVFIGMLDPNPAIRGLGEQHLREAGIDVQRFPKDLADQVEEINRMFIREQKTKAKILEPVLPNLILSFDKDRDVECQANTDGLDPSVLSKWVRIRVENPNDRKVAKKCRGHLLGIKPLGTDTKVGLPNSSRPLKWENHPEGFERDIHGGSEDRLDVLHAANNETCLRFSTYPDFSLGKPGNYELTIRVTAEDREAEDITVRIGWAGKWETLKAMD